MIKSIGRFPFGEQVHKVVQSDRTRKDVFILGVYASAVHARWVNANGKTLVNALAVASEPYIFWRGENPEFIIDKIHVPHEIGKLLPAKPTFNGPSGIALDNLILEPLGLERNDVWLCDLVPHSCLNPAQKKAIDREYLPIAKKYDLPLPSVPPLPRPLTDEKRRNEILSEMLESNTRVLILLGDLPIRWFLYYFDKRWKKLSDFVAYGQIHETEIRNKKVAVLPLAHPRQIAKLGQSSSYWFNVHRTWIQAQALLRSGK